VVARVGAQTSWLFGLVFVVVVLAVRPEKLVERLSMSLALDVNDDDCWIEGVSREEEEDEVKPLMMFVVF
jgi:hypothetical protein